MKRIFEEGAEVRYNDLIVTDEHIPVIIQYVYKTKEESDARRRHHSKAYEIVDDVFHSEVITEIIEQQDKPGAINNKVESHNMDVAD